MAVLAPRAVIVTRPTDLESLLSRHATLGQAEFFLQSRGQSITPLQERHANFERCKQSVLDALPDHWRQAQVSRDDLSRFVFAEQDFIIAVGQDGLIANLAKYSNERPVLGVNPEPELIEGILARFTDQNISDVYVGLEHGDFDIERRTMVQARLETGQSLTALNEMFVGHRSHQSARYELRLADASENQSSSGLIIASGTGMTGWAKSIVTAARLPMELDPCDSNLAYFAREPWPSISTGNTMLFGKVSTEQNLNIRSAMNEGGVIFADGIESDRLNFDWGNQATISPSLQKLNLVTGA